MTIKDIARNLGISYSTVSRALNDDPKVSSKTKKKVQEEATRVGFAFNINARNLVKKKTNTIGVVFSNNFNLTDYRWFYNEMEFNLIENIVKYEYDFLIQPNTNIKNESNIYKMVNGQKVDGIVIASKQITKEEYEFLEKSKIPYVFLYFKPTYINENIENIFFDDNEYGGYIATKYLIELGHREILTISTNDKDLRMYDERTLGYEKAMKEANLKPKVIKTHMNFESQPQLIKSHLKEIQNASAIFAQQDLVALSIVQTLKRDYDMVIPEDLSIIGYNNIDLIKYLDIDLDTIKDPRAEVIENCVEYLVAKINKKERSDIPNKLYPKLIQRGTTQSIK